MRSFPIRGGLAVLLVFLIWLCAGRWCSLLVDRFYKVPIATIASTPLGWNGSYLQFGSSLDGTLGPKGWSAADLQIGSHILDLSGPGPSYNPAASLQVEADDRLVLFAGGQSLVLGHRAGTMPGVEAPIPAFAAEPGDETSLSLERSGLSWPTPFEFNFMTGSSPSWRRHLYYHLSWRKRSGARLEMLWRFEQGFRESDGWTAPGGDDDSTGLVFVGISPAAGQGI